MSKVTMPEPVILRTIMPDDYRYGHVYGYTRKHMEAYADARVREALEVAAKICWEMQGAPEFGKDDKDRWLAIAESRIRSMIKE